MDVAADSGDAGSTGADEDSCVASTEVCDGLDNDCDGLVDEGLSQSWYADVDGDGWGDPAASRTACARPDGYVAQSGDCDDTAPSVYPGAVETCDDRDEDCDDEIDEGLETTLWYPDGDSDGWGVFDGHVEDCRQPDGMTDVVGDCDDEDATRHRCRSCLEILEAGLSTGDGDYALDTTDCGEWVAWCDMTTDGGGWTELVDLEAETDACPGDWQPADLGFARVCTRQATQSSEYTRTALVDSCGVSYDEVLGNASMFQMGSTDAFGDFPSTSIDGAYGDLLSITVGTSRLHVHSFVLGFLSGGTDDSNCPAIGGASPPSWVGSDYFCATGNPSTTSNERIWYDTPLFAADWFQRSLPSSVSDDVEARLIATHDSADEDLGVARLILRVR